MPGKKTRPIHLKQIIPASFFNKKLQGEGELYCTTKKQIRSTKIDMDVSKDRILSAWVKFIKKFPVRFSVQKHLVARGAKSPKKEVSTLMIKFFRSDVHKGKTVSTCVLSEQNKPLKLSMSTVKDKTHTHVFKVKGSPKPFYIRASDHKMMNKMAKKGFEPVGVI